jgi:hypothetical protein
LKSLAGGNVIRYRYIGRSILFVTFTNALMTLENNPGSFSRWASASVKQQAGSSVEEHEHSSKGFKFIHSSSSALSAINSITENYSLYSINPTAPLCHKFDQPIDQPFHPKSQHVEPKHEPHYHEESPTHEKPVLFGRNDDEPRIRHP